jgi:hypothetical protein
MKTMGKSSIEIEFTADAAWVTQEFASFFKEINRFNPNDCNAIASFYKLLVKNYKINTRFFK